MSNINVSDICEGLMPTVEVWGQPLDYCGGKGEYVAVDTEFGRTTITFCELCTLALLENPKTEQEFFGPASAIEWMMLRDVRAVAGEVDRLV